MYIDVDSQKCSGCTACKAVCPVNAIKMGIDEEGFYVPVVEKNICVNCGMCNNVCPAKKTTNESKYGSMDVYAIKWNSSVRNKSASGAFFPAIAKWIIEQKSGYVCGCVFDDNLIPTHIVSNKWNDVIRMQDSKYVQSSMENCFSEIIELLKKGEWVLFTGTSCQVSGLLSIVEQLRINSNYLITIDFFCHGVPSPNVWKDYIRFYEKEKRRNVVGYRFRSKKYGWGEKSRGSSHLNCIKYKTKSKLKEDNVSLAARLWRTIFFSNICIRKYCHQCPYASVNKPADITMGDFWGIENVLKEFDDGKGCSVGILRSDKARALISEISYLNKTKVDLRTAVNRQKNAFEPSKAHPLREQFWKDYYNLNFKELSEKYFYYSYKTKIKGIIKRILFMMHLRNIY